MTPSPTASDVEAAAGLMAGFARRTGVDAGAPPRRYLWTDAFAVCNFLELHRLTGQSVHSERAVRLVEQVHHTLGRHRDDDPRSGWISGLDEQEGRRRPTAGGLRIGKELPERGQREPIDQRLEWERDGQYYHYLTRWMHALLQTATATGDERYHRWATELAVVAREKFTLRTGDQERLVWKMSIALNRPQVASMGQHDPLDGWITALTLLASRPRGTGGTAAGPAEADPAAPDAALARAAATLGDLASRTRWATDDPLGLGSLLVDAWRIAQLEARGAVSDPSLLAHLLDEARRSFAAFSPESLRLPLDQRLAFRELGLAIGLQALERLAAWGADPAVANPVLRSRVTGLERWLPLAAEVAALWSEPSSQAAPTWSGHRDINEVMLATCLVPDGYLRLT